MTTTEPMATGRARTSRSGVDTPRPADIADPATSDDAIVDVAFDTVISAARERDETIQLASVRARLLEARRELLDEEDFDADAAVERQLRARRNEIRLAEGLADLNLAAQAAEQRRHAQAEAEHARIKNETAATNADIDKQARDRRARARLGTLDRGDELWAQRALRRRRKLTDPVKHLGEMLREYLLVRTALDVLTLIGIVWTSYGVAHALAGAHPSILFYGIEPLFSVPLVMIVRMLVTAAKTGRSTKVRLFHTIVPAAAGATADTTPVTAARRLTALGWLALILLSATVLVNVWPTLHASFSFEQFLTHFAAPVLIVIAMVLQAIAADLFGDIIGEAYIGVTEDGSSRLPEEARDAIELAHRTRQAMDEGRFEAKDINPSDTLPSISAMQRFFAPIMKQRCQRAHDVLVQENELIARAARHASCPP